MGRMLGVHHDLDSDESVLKALTSIGMHAEPLALETPARTSAVSNAASGNKELKLLLGLSGVSALAAEALAWLAHSDASAPVIALAVVAIVSGGLPPLHKGWIALKTLTLNINFLMSLAVIGAVAIGQWPEAAMVIFLFAVAEMIEAMSLNRARNAVQGLLQIVLETATVLMSDGRVETKRADQVEVGAVIRVKSGERIPLDGIVEEGDSAVN